MHMEVRHDALISLRSRCILVPRFRLLSVRRQGSGRINKLAGDSFRQRRRLLGLSGYFWKCGVLRRRRRRRQFIDQDDCGAADIYLATT